MITVVRTNVPKIKLSIRTSHRSSIVRALFLGRFLAPMESTYSVRLAALHIWHERLEVFVQFLVSCFPKPIFSILS